MAAFLAPLLRALAGSSRALSGRAGARIARGKDKGSAVSRTDRFTKADAKAVRRGIERRGAEYRDAYEAAGGDGDPSAGDVAKEMIERRRQQEREDEADRAEQKDMKDLLQQSAAAYAIHRVNKLMHKPSEAAEYQKLIIQDRYRDIAKRATGEIPLVGGHISKLIDSLGLLTDAITKKGEALAPFSGELATTSAKVKVRQLMKDVDEAQKAGKSYADTMDEQSKLQTDLQEAFTPLKIEIAQNMTSLLRLLREVLEAIKPILPVLEESMKISRYIHAGIRVLIRISPIGRAMLGDADDEQRKKDDEKKLEQMLIWLTDDPAIGRNHQADAALPPDQNAFGF